MKIPFSKIPLAGNELKYINDVLESGWWTTSAKALQFERLFADFIGAKFACAVNSCTAALHLAVEAVGIKNGDKVLVPTLTFTASAEILRYLGADPVLIDVEYGTGLVTPQILKEALMKNPNARALILVHYGGQSPVMTTPDSNGIVDICKMNNILLIEDAAHAFPTKFNNQYIGTFGDVTCFSFYANKTITTGEGGMLVTDNEAIHERAKIMRLHGINHDIWDRFTTRTCSWEYDVIAPGFKYNMPDLNAAIGLAQLEKAEYFRVQRQRCASFYLEHLQNVPNIDLPVCLGPLENNSWHLFPVVIKPQAPVTRDEFVKLMADEGIGTSVHYKPLHRMSYYKLRYDLTPEKYPNAERIWEGRVSLPIYPELSNDDLEVIVRTIQKILLQEKM